MEAAHRLVHGIRHPGTASRAIAVVATGVFLPLAMSRRNGRTPLFGNFALRSMATSVEDLIGNAESNLGRINSKSWRRKSMPIAPLIAGVGSWQPSGCFRNPTGVDQASN
jgi:hypothetical protein